MANVDYGNQDAYCAKPDGSATVQVGEGKIEVIDGKLHLSGNLDLTKNVVGGQIQPKGKVKIGGVAMTPGVSMGTGVIVSGIDLTQHVGKDLDVEQHPDGTIEIKGIFQ